MAETALITGASSGIGEEFARQLSERGYETILVARRKDRMEKLASELQTKAEVIECDLGKDAASLPGKVKADVDLLINNAGFGLRGRFWETDAERLAEMVRLNCEAVVVLTRAFLPAMIERGRGGVITIASSAGMQPLPYEATYAASKAFALNLTDALHMELKGTGVKALAVNPGPVPTEWQAVAGTPGGEVPPGIPGVIEAPQVVSEALDAYDKGQRSLLPGTRFRWFMRASSVGPRGVALRVAERIYRPEN